MVCWGTDREATKDLHFLFLNNKTPQKYVHHVNLFLKCVLYSVLFTGVFMWALLFTSVCYMYVVMLCLLGLCMSVLLHEFVCFVACAWVRVFVLLRARVCVCVCVLLYVQGNMCVFCCVRMHGCVRTGIGVCVRLCLRIGVFLPVHGCVCERSWLRVCVLGPLSVHVCLRARPVGGL